MKIHLILVTLLVALLFTSCCITGDNQTESQSSLVATNTYNDEYVSFDYPNSWVEASTTYSYVIAAFGDPSSLDANNKYQTVVIVQRMEASGNSLKNIYDDVVESMQQQTEFEIISEKDTTIDGIDAKEIEFTFNDNGMKKHQRNVYFKNKGYVYAILCMALEQDFNNENKNFDIIFNTFRVV